jgi:integrase
LGKTPIYDITRPQLLELLSRIEQRKAFTTAEKVRGWFRQLFRYALVVVEGLETNPASDLDVVAVPKPPVIHNPFLRLEELPAMLQKLRAYRGRSLQTQLGIRLLLLLTGVRTGELRSATPDQFDLEQGLWIIPPLNVKQLQNSMRKAGRRPQVVPPYIVPLSFLPGCRGRPLPAGRDQAGPALSAGASQRSEEAHQRKYSEQCLAPDGL